MNNLYIAFGSWKIRHNEPTHAQERILYLRPVVININTDWKTVVLQWQDACSTQNAFAFDEFGCKINNNFFTDEQLDLVEYVPLALISIEDKIMKITHLLIRVDDKIAQFLSIANMENTILLAPLWKTLENFFEMYHITFLNHECFYIKDSANIELEQKFNFESPYSYLELCKKMYQELDEGLFPDFIPQFGDEFQFWNYDNNLYEIMENEMGEAGYVSIMHYCWNKNKKRWDEPFFIFKKKLFNCDRVERWEKNYENNWVEGDKQAVLEEFFKFKINYLAPLRRAKCDVAFENVFSSNIFMVSFDNCEITDPQGSFRKGELRQCEIEFLKSRGSINKDQVYSDFHQLVALMEKFMERNNIFFQRTNYSKLSFLKDCQTVVVNK